MESIFCYKNYLGILNNKPTDMKLNKISKTFKWSQS